MHATTTAREEQADQGCWRGRARRSSRQQQQQEDEEEQQAPGLKADLRANANIVRHHPATLLVPLLLLAVLLTAGVVGVVWGASNEAYARQRYATGQAESYAIRIRARLQQVYPAVGQLIYAIRRQPSSWAKLDAALADAADEIFHLANGTVSAIGLAPQGHFLTQYNSVVGGSGPTAQQQQVGQQQIMGLPALGLDLFAANSSHPEGRTWRDLALYALEAGGPVFSSAANSDVNGSLGVVYWSPVFVPANCSTGVGSDVGCNNTGAGQPAGITTLPADVTPATNCSLCLESHHGLTFWGTLLVVTDLHLALADAGLYAVESGDVVQGYRYRVQAPNRAVGAAGDWDRLTTVAQSRLPVVRPVRVEIAMDTSDDKWVLELSPEKGSWSPAWTWPLVALVVCVSLTLAALQLRVALAAHRHRLLLEALLPAEVLNDLRREHDYSSPKLAELATGTPAQSILNLTSSVLHGELPDAREAVMVRAAVLRRADIYRPADLGAKIKASNLDDDVAHALMRQLACSDSGGVPLPTWPGSLMGQGLPMYVGSTRSDFDGPPSSRRASSQAPEVFATLQSALAAIITRAPETMWHPGMALPPSQTAPLPTILSGLPPLSKHRSQELSGFAGSALLMADYPCIEDPGDIQPASDFPEGPASQPAMQQLATASQAGWGGSVSNPLYGRSSAGAIGGASSYGAAALASLASAEGVPRNAVASYPRQPRSQRQSGSPKAAAAAAATVSISAVAGPAGSGVGGAGTTASVSGPPGENSWSPGLGSLNNLIASYYRRRSSCTSTTLAGGATAVPSPALTAASGNAVEGGDRATAGTGSDVFSISDAASVNTATAGYAAVHRSRSMAPSTLTRTSSVNMPLTLWEEAERSLSLSWEWQFDAPALAAATQGHPLSTLGFYVLTTTGLARRFKIKPDVLARYLCRVEGLYIDNPYHNAVHAADVLQTMHVLIQRGGLVQHGYTDPLAQLACYMAAIVHDLGHPGRTNDFLIATSDDLAVRYNDKAPLENHHVSQAFALLRQPGMNFLAALSRDERCMLRRMVIELVLGTDMKQHFALLAQFNTLKQAASVASHASSLLPTLAPPSPVAAPNESEGAVAARTLSNARCNSVLYRTSRTLADMASSPRGRRHSALVLAPAGAGRTAADGAGMASSPSPQSPVVVDEAGRLLVLQLALKCADLGHLAATLPIHLHWVAALEEEMFRQGDAEKAAGLPVSPLFDRTKPGITKSQIGFLDIVVLPLFRGITTLLPRALPLAEAVHANYAYWHSQQHTTAASSPAGSGSPHNSAPMSPQKAPECSEEQV